MTVSSIYQVPATPYISPVSVPALSNELWSWLSSRLNSPEPWSYRPEDGRAGYLVGPGAWGMSASSDIPRGANGEVLAPFRSENVILFSTSPLFLRDFLFDQQLDAISPVWPEVSNAVLGSSTGSPALLTQVTVDTTSLPGRVMAYVPADTLRSLLEARRTGLAQQQANALWSQAWQGASFDTNYNNWLKGVANDPLRAVTGTKVNLTIAVSGVIRSKTEAVLQLNSRMADINVLLKRLNTMAAENKNKPDTDWAYYVKGIPIGSSYAGGNQWAAQEKPIWDSWGIDTSKFSVDTRSGKGDVYCDKGYIEPTIEALKIALDKASSDAQQLQLDLNNLMTQYNGQFDAASAIYKRKDTLDQSLQPR